MPRLAAEWDLDAPGEAWQALDATLCFVDISGFTSLSERLARRGRIGAEELTEVLNRVFGSMLTLAYDRGGALLKFGGDALLLLFRGDDHALQACSAAVELRAALRDAARVPTSVGRVALRMSVGVHTGAVDLFRVGTSHRELVVAGPAASATTAMEQAAGPGDIVVSAATRALLPADAAPTSVGPGWALRWRRPAVPGTGPVRARPVGPDAVAGAIPLGLRHHLADRGADPEHRVASVAFVRFGGVDALMEGRGPNAVAAAIDEVVTAVQRAADGEGVTFLGTDIDADGGKIILVGGVPSAQDDDEGRVLRVCPARGGRGLAPADADRHQPRPCLRRRGRHPVALDVHRHGRHGQRGCPAHGCGAAGADLRHRARARPLAHPVRRHRTRAAPREGQDRPAPGLCRRKGAREPHL